jgi:presenilin-like A22 family membrane protease
MAPGDAIIEHPNREKAESKSTRAIVVALLLVSAAVVLIVTVGGWRTLSGAYGLLVGYILAYVVIAFYIARWRSGLLPVAAALGIVLLIFALIGGPQWFSRDKDGFSDPLLDEAILGALTFLLVPLQALLIAFAARGFSQRWSVEVERSAGRPGQYVQAA